LTERAIGASATTKRSQESTTEKNNYLPEEHQSAIQTGYWQQSKGQIFQSLIAAEQAMTAHGLDL
jgi:hypothetical protein